MLFHPHSHLLCMSILEHSIGALGPCFPAALADILTRLRGLGMTLSHHLAIVCSHWAADRSGYSAGRSQVPASVVTVLGLQLVLSHGAPVP